MKVSRKTRGKIKSCKKTSPCCYIAQGKEEDHGNMKLIHPSYILGWCLYVASMEICFQSSDQVA